MSHSSPKNVAEEPLPLDDRDPFAPDLALLAPEPLATFNRAGLLIAADIHVALTLTQLGGLPHDTDDGRAVLLAAALAVRAPRLGHVFIDLATARETVALEDDGGEELGALPWPDPERWLQAVAGAGALVAIGEPDGPGGASGERATDGGGGSDGGTPGTGGGTRPEPRPLRLLGARLYLDRYWHEERQLAVALASLDAAPLRRTELAELGEAVARLFPDAGDAGQRIAAACGVLRGLTVVAGGPGTGKTTTVARLAALLIAERPPGEPPPLIALCAPTGKAAARLQEAIHREAETLPVDADTRLALMGLRASTIHRLLGWAGGGGRFRHHAGNRLPHDVVIVDETSMVSLSLMGRLVEAVRGDARLVLVGDPDQLSAIEAGAVLRDIVGPAADNPRFGDGMRVLLTQVAGSEPAPAVPAAPTAPTATSSPPETPVAPAASFAAASTSSGRPFGDGIAVLRRGHRFGAAIGALADAIRSGDPEATLAAATAAPDQIEWIRYAPGASSASSASSGSSGSSGSAGTKQPSAAEAERLLAPLRAQVGVHYGAVVRAARDGDAATALAALARFRLLCAHRHGPYGVSQWTARVQRWLAEAVPDFDPDAVEYAGKPLLIAANDYELRLYNGDTGVLVATDSDDERLTAAFERDGQIVGFSPARLGATEPVYATTVHKSQGSQFEVTAIVLPEPGSRLLTRELLYTAVTRARDRLLLIGDEASLRAAVARPVARATGLRERLWESTTL
jgi:exodeoxyribonuclease V alpha subunit